LRDRHGTRYVEDAPTGIPHIVEEPLEVLLDILFRLLDMRVRVLTVYEPLEALQRAEDVSSGMFTPRYPRVVLEETVGGLKGVVPFVNF
jgi:hypothetical protein